MVDPATMKSRAWARFLGRVATVLLSALPVAGAADGTTAELDRYRDLNLVLMIAEGAGLDWAQRLGGAETGQLELSAAELASPVDLDRLQTPLNRIADPERNVAEAATLFRYARAHDEAIRSQIADFATAHPAAVTRIDPAQLAEDALIIRSALTADIEFLGRDSHPAWLPGLDVYRQKTVYLRNMMEYWSFDRELAALTEQALLDTGTRIEAYQRLLAVDPRLDAFTQHLRAVEHVYRQYGIKSKDPDDPSDGLIDAASQVD